jgi:hypothetical protein
VPKNCVVRRRKLNPLRLRPYTAESLQEANAAVDIANHLQRNGINVAVPLPAGHDRIVNIDEDYVVTRESIAPGVQLTSLRANGILPRDVFDVYRDTVLDIYQKGADIDPNVLSKKAMIYPWQVLDQVLARNEEARNAAALYAMADSQKVLAANPTLAKEFGSFHDDLADALKAGWQQNDIKALETYGLVHDAHAGNFFYDSSQPPGKRLTAIDFGSDYLGPAGDMFAMIAREARPPGGWDYDGFAKFVDGLFVQYEQRTGKPLSIDAKLEILRSMAVPPYKFISSDSRIFRASLEADVQSFQGQTLADKLQTGGGHAVLEKMLRDPVASKKYADELGQMQFTLKMLHDMTTNPDEKSKLEPVLETLKDARAVGRRLAAADIENQDRVL